MQCVWICEGLYIILTTLPIIAVSLGGYDIGLWQVLAVLTFPIVCMKLPLNLLILKISCQDIAAIDIAKRANSKVQ